MLDPLPIGFDAPSHTYWWQPTGEQMVWSVSEVVKPMTEANRIWLEKHPEYAERGTAIHAVLEQFLKGEEVEHPQEYTEWTDKLLFDSWWDDVDEVLALEHRLADPGKGIGGSFDGLVRRGGETWIYDLKTKSSKDTARPKPYAQLGGYSRMLEKHYKTMPDKGLVIWSWPGGCKFEDMDIDKCLAKWEQAYEAHEAREAVNCI